MSALATAVAPASLRLDQLDILTAQNIQGSPALETEVLSPSTRKRDRQVKRRLYARSGVREY